MMVRNFELDRLEAKRDKVRKEVCTLMKRKDYYTNVALYHRVAALTGLETYLTYAIEELTAKITSVHDDDNLV